MSDYIGDEITQCLGHIVRGFGRRTKGKRQSERMTPWSFGTYTKDCCLIIMVKISRHIYFIMLHMRK